MTKHLSIGKTEDAKTKIRENLFSFLVRFYLLLMNLTVNLNNQSFGRTAEINDKPVNRILAAEFITVELRSAQALPEQIFSRCRLVTHLPGNRPQFPAELRILAWVVLGHDLIIAWKLPTEYP